MTMEFKCPETRHCSRGYFVPNSNYVASIPSGIPKRQISLRPPQGSLDTPAPFIYPIAAKQGLITRFLPGDRFLPAAVGQECIVGKPRNCGSRYITAGNHSYAQVGRGAWGAHRALPTTANHLSFHVNLHFKSSYISRNPAFWARNPVGGREAGRSPV